MSHWSPMEWVFAIAVACMVGWGLVLFSKAVTKAVADVWFSRKEQHTRRIIEMSKEDK